MCVVSVEINSDIIPLNNVSGHSRNEINDPFVLFLIVVSL
jgi:hypothetical protein